jgi:hypothetical protein
MIYLRSFDYSQTESLASWVMQTRRVKKKKTVEDT